MKRCAISTCQPVGVLTRGSTADVWLARRRGAEVVVKVYDERHHSEHLTRQECRADRLDHPHIAKVFGGGRALVDWGQPPIPGDDPARRYYTVQAHAPGRVLKDAFDWPTLRAVLRGVLLGLEHAHGQGLLHRDIKPGNIIVEGVGPATMARIIDWGICWDMAPGARNAFPGLTAGTPGYMPLEQVLAQRHHLGPWSDLYAVGCLAHRLAAGHTPVRGVSHRQVLDSMKATALAGEKMPNHVRAAEWGQGFVDWVGWLMAIPIASRPQSAREALDALEVIEAPAARYEDLPWL